MAARSSQSEVEVEGEKEGQKHVTEEGVEAGLFDPCVENFFSDMDHIRKLCSPSSQQEDLDSADIDRFSSMITFLKEWKYLQYEPSDITPTPRTVRFSCDSEVTATSPDPIRRELNLPQFSSAAIPNAGKLAGEADSSISDFVLYAGGNVWALDWCPRADDKPDSTITCEYLAVSAHPPGSNYHKMGASLMGRGAIQIWCLVTTIKTVEMSKPSYRVVKGRPKKAFTVKDGAENDKQKSLALTKPRGRPKKVSLTDETSSTLVAEPKKRGRPRKRPISEEDARATVPKKRGRPRKHTQCSTLEENACAIVPRKSRPRKNARSSTVTALAPLPPPDANSAENCYKGGWKKGKFQSLKAYLLAASTELNADQEGHNVAAHNEANLPPVVEPLNVAWPSSFRFFKKYYKRRSKGNQSTQKPDSVAVDNSTGPDVTLNEHQTVQLHSTETQCNSESQLVSSVCRPKETLLPKLVFCLAHYGKVAWDIKWKPFEPSSNARMGYLALLLGNGSLEVWDVPVPNTVHRLYNSNRDREEGTDPRFLKLKPIFRCSKLTFGNRQSIPLTLEWSPSPPSDMILAGCHDGTVALWKFAVQSPCQDSRPLLVFTADSAPIRSLAWAPRDSENAENSNLFVAAGPEGLKFWDIRDPYHSLWEVNQAHRAVLSVDWLKDPRCILMTLEDGTMRVFSLPKGANDLPVTGMPLPRKQFEGLYIYTMSHFAIWSISSSPTGLVAYCVSDGSVIVFQLTERFLEPDPTRNRTPYFLCDYFKDKGGILGLGPSYENIIVPNLPLKPIKGSTRYIMGEDKALVSACDPPTNGGVGNIANAGTSHEGDDGFDNAFPSKLVALHKVRWNKNKGTERWLCYGGAAGIIRLQKISINF